MDSLRKSTHLCAHALSIDELLGQEYAEKNRHNKRCNQSGRSNHAIPGKRINHSERQLLRALCVQLSKQILYVGRVTSVCVCVYRGL